MGCTPCSTIQIDDRWFPRFEVLTALLQKIQVLREVKPCLLVIVADLPRIVSNYMPVNA